jgi:hypothetical protein
MSVNAQTDYNTCYVIRARDATTNQVYFAANKILQYYQLPMVMNDTPEAHAERLGSLTPVMTFSIMGSRGNRFTVFLLEIDNMETVPPFTIPGDQVNYIPAPETTRLFRSFCIKYNFSRIAVRILETIQRQLSALGHPPNYRWFLWDVIQIPGAPYTEFSEEDECFCYSHSTSGWWKLPCNHHFHRVCIESWQKQCVDQANVQFTCPACRHVLN